MSQFQLTSQAQNDLVSIRRFTLSQWGVAQSEHYLSDLRGALQLLSEMPLMGKSCDDLGADVHRFLFGSHAIYYIILGDGIMVIAILHQSMVPAHHLANRPRL